MLTINPHRDAEAHENEQDYKEQERDYMEAKKLKQIDDACFVVTRELNALTPENWLEPVLHHGKYHMSGDDVFGACMEGSPDVQAAWAKLATSDAGRELREAMARHHAELCYTEILQPLPPERVRLLAGGEHQADSI